MKVKGGYIGMGRRGKFQIKLVFLLIVIVCSAQVFGAFNHDVDVIPVNPTTADSVFVTLSGEWNNSCVPAGIFSNVDGDEIKVAVTAPGGFMCADVMSGWGETTELGRLEKGTYSLSTAVGTEMMPGTGVYVYTYQYYGEIEVESSVITVDDDGPADFNNIQGAIDFSKDGDTVLVADGTYTGSGNRDIDFGGKAITVKSENGAESTIINCGGDPNLEIEHRGFYFHNGEGQDSVLDGFTITGGFVYDCGGSSTGGAGIKCNEASPIVKNCIITENYTKLIPECLGFCQGGGVGISGDGSGFSQQCSPTFINCIISNNAVGDFGYGGGVFDGSGAATFINCVIAGNSASSSGGVCGGISSNGGTIVNCIIWANVNGQIAGPPTVSYSCVEGGYSGTGNIDTDPCFAGSGDYHLKSEAGRWDSGSESWVVDGVTSLCIDAGDMSTAVGYEVFPNGGRVNMGAYGGTSQGSKSYFGAEPCETVIAGDINGDCKVDFVDLALLAYHWQE